MIKKVITIVSAVLFSTVVCNLRADSGMYQTIPICLPGEKTVAFALEIQEKVYANKPDYKKVLNTIVKDGKEGAPSAEAMVAMFLDARLNKDVERMKGLIAGSVRAPQQKELDRGAKLVSKWAKIKLIKKWSYGNYHTIIMKQIAPDGHTEKNSINTVVINGRHYLAMDFPSQLRMLYGYMMSEESRCPKDSIGYSKLNYTLEFIPSSSTSQKDNKLGVRINAIFNEFTENWSAQNRNSENQASNFFCQAREIALNGSDQEFISLWSGNEHLRTWSKKGKPPKIDKNLIEENYSDFKRLRSHYKNTVFGSSPFKQVCSIKLGKYVVHYYLTKEKPKDLKAITFVEVNDKYYLSNGLNTNIRYFLTSGRLPDRLLKIWQSR